jgi:putative ABC transport system permease protein
MKDEMRGIIRAKRRLKPRAEDNFALNEVTMIANALDSFFGVLNAIGFLIGGFSILVGGVSVANIMFVSVKERTSLIGVKKALGAKRYIILLEFLIEAIILCIIGGLLGLLMVFGVTKVISQFIPFEIYLNAGNAIMGLTISIAIGIIAGFIPALQASQMDPVEAMRS